MILILALLLLTPTLASAFCNDTIVLAPVPTMYVFSPSDTTPFNLPFTYDLKQCPWYEERLEYWQLALAGSNYQYSLTIAHDYSNGSAYYHSGFTQGNLPGGTVHNPAQLIVSFSVDILHWREAARFLVAHTTGPIPTQNFYKRRLERERTGRQAPYEVELACARGTRSCFIGAGIWECLDVSSDLEACGGCPYDDGVDCTAIPGVEAVGCERGLCVVQSCVEGMSLVDGRCASQL